jgi:CheY-like chemotaxis protein
MSGRKQEPVRPQPLRILVVEDNDDGREVLRLLLELSGYEVEVAADGVEGVRKAVQGHPDVVLSDIGLPRLDGYQMARQMRRQLGGDLFLISQTSYSQPEDRRRALEAGFDVHLVKPVDPHELFAWLHEAENCARLHSVPRQPGPANGSGDNAGGDRVGGDGSPPTSLCWSHGAAAVARSVPDGLADS